MCCLERAGMAWVISREVSNLARFFSRPVVSVVDAAADNEDDASPWILLLLFVV